MPAAHRFYPDVEFLVEDPTARGLVSFGAVDDAGREIYRINRDVDLAAVAREPFLMDHVVPHLPLRVVHSLTAGPALDGPRLVWDRTHPDYPFVKPVDEIASDLTDWFAFYADTEPRAYGYYGVDDFARLHRLWNGRWGIMPRAVPRVFQDLEAIVRALDLEAEPSGINHRAIDDAHAHRALHELLMEKADWVALL
ncbi:hypothetical protein AB0D90_03705 [Streptomyces althioticus]|uniref:hypothetical protein n=1 Tax=Streptomyces althioticus TaxID=83380 RepID=UPI0034099980